MICTAYEDGSEYYILNPSYSGKGSGQTKKRRKKKKPYESDFGFDIPGPATEFSPSDAKRKDFK